MPDTPAIEIPAGQACTGASSTLRSNETLLALFILIECRLCVTPVFLTVRTIVNSRLRFQRKCCKHHQQSSCQAALACFMLNMAPTLLKMLVPYHKACAGRSTGDAPALDNARNGCERCS